MNQEKAQSGAEQVVKLTRADLPAYCPTESMGLWNSHPRVYIPLEETPVACCPYCGTRFELIDAG
jgi:uncharacterized Zn-finger protein